MSRRMDSEDLIMLAGVKLLSNVYLARGIQDQVEAQDRLADYAKLLTGLEEQDKLYSLLAGYYEYKGYQRQEED